MEKINQYREWNDWEIQFLKDNYIKMTDEELGIILNRTKCSVETKRKKIGLKRIRAKIKYSQEEAKNQLVKIFNKINRLPTKEDGRKLKMKPARDWYVDKYGSVENAGVYFGIIEEGLNEQERIEISIKELKEIANNLGRVPLLNEYEEMKNKGYSFTPLKAKINMTYTELCEKYLFEYIVIDIVPEGHKKCSICKEIKPLNEFYLDNVREIGVTSACKVCSYLKRNKLNIPNGWTKEECLIIIDYIINEKIIYVNDLCKILTNKILDDFVDLLSNEIRIGNKHLYIKTYCAYCGKEDIKNLGTYNKNKNCFCSLECYWKYKEEFEPDGEDHPSYKRVKTLCDNCECEIAVIPWKINNYEHNFCSQECYWEFRSKYYIGDKHPQFGVKRTEEQRRKQRIITTKLYSDGVFNKQTIPQKIVNFILEDLDVKYENEYNCKYYSIDNYLTDYNLMIEVMGDYFHANPIKFREINEMQYNDIVKDKRKRTYIKKYKGINILYLWEKDINNNIELIKNIIKCYINNDGNLIEYNSFNYFLHDNDLLVNGNLIKPYMDYTAKELNEIKK